MKNNKNKLQRKLHFYKSKMIKNSRNHTLSIVVVLLTMLIVVSASAVHFRLQYINEKNNNVTYPEQLWDVGEIAVDSRFAFGLLGVDVDEEYAQRYSDAPHYKFISPKVYFRNYNDEIYHLSPIATMQIKDNISGLLYTVTGAPNTENPVGGPIQADTSTIGGVGFTVPKDSNDFTLIFTPNLEGARQIKVPFTI